MGGYIGATAVGLTTTAVDVQGDITSTDTTPELILKNTSEEDTEGGREGKITFKGEQSGGEETTLAQIESAHDGTSDDEKGDLIFKTNDGSDGASPTEAMRIDSSQNVGIGCVPNSIQSGFDTLQIGGNLTLNVDSTGAGAGVYMGNNVYRDSGNSRWEYTYTDEASQYLQAGGEHIWRYAASGTADTAITWSEAMRISADGDVAIGTTSPNSYANYNVLTIDGTSGGVLDLERNGTLTGEIYVGANELLIDAVGSSSFLNFQTNSTERMRIDSSGSVGIGTSSPSDYYANHLVVDIGSSAQSGISIVADTGGEGMFAFADGTSGDARYRGYVNYNHTSDFMNIGTAGTERMRIDSTGRLGVGSSSPATYSGRIVSQISGGSSSPTIACVNSTVGGTLRMIDFFQGTSTSRVGSIESTSSSTSYNTSSDHRLKENVTDISDGITRVKQLAPKRFNFIVDADTTVDGFIAHEAQSVVPEAVTGTKDAMTTEEYEVTPAVEATYDDEGNELTPAVEAVMGEREVPDYQGIDQSKLVPLLTAALQEAIAKIETLETKVAALEGA